MMQKLIGALFGAIALFAATSPASAGSSIRNLCGDETLTATNINPFDSENTNGFKCVVLPDGLAVTGSASSAAVLSGFPVDTLGTAYQSISVQFTVAGSGNTVMFEESNDGNAYIAVLCIRPDAVTSAASSALPASTNFWVCPVRARWFQLRVSTYGSGTVTAAVAFRNAQPNPAAFSGFTLNASNANNANGGLTPTEAPSAQCDDTSTTVATENNFANLRIGCGGRALYTDPLPTSDAAGALSSTAPSGNGPAYNANALVACTSACNGYAVDAETQSSAGYVMVFNVSGAPADGAVTPEICRAVAANTPVRITLGTEAIPRRFSTGLTVVFSTGANCRTKTASPFDMVSVLAK